MTYDNKNIQIVELEKVKKKLKRLPRYVVKKLLQWAKDVEEFGLSEVKKAPGYHDEPLKGRRKGEFSIRLSKSYRAIYTVSKNLSIKVIIVNEVNKHDY
jgi:proteic killer suppression protein